MACGVHSTWGSGPAGSSSSIRQLSAQVAMKAADRVPVARGGAFEGWQGASLAALDGFQQGVEGACGGGGGGDVADAVAFGVFEVHAEAPQRGGGVVGGERLDPEHELDFVAGAQVGERGQGVEHAPCGEVGGFVGVLEREGAHEGANGFAHAGWMDGSVWLIEGARVGLEGCFGLCWMHSGADILVMF
jgi:hypothetical protein